MQILKSITLENFRVFRTKHEIELKPITVLIGPNSSGKSSVIKSLILSKHNSENKLEILDFTGAKHNLGTIDNVINTNSKGKPVMSLGYRLEFFAEKKKGRFAFSGNLVHRQPIQTSRGSYYVRMLRNFRNLSRTEVYLKFYFIPMSGNGEIIKIQYFLANQEKPFIEIDFTEGRSQNYKLLVDLDQVKSNEVLNEIFIKPALSLASAPSHIKEESRKKDPVIKIPSGTIVSRVPSEYYKNKNSSTKNVIQDLFVDYIKSLIGNKNEAFLKYASTDMANVLSTYLGENLDNVDFMEAYRANTRRIYTNDSQGTSFNELILDFKSRKRSKFQTSFINRWLKEFEIGDRMLDETIEGVATSIKIEKDGKKTALADLGFGYTQILPLIMKIALELPRPEAMVPSSKQTKEQKALGADHRILDRLFMLEEPETNLHPKLQSKLADFIFDASQKFSVNFILETHSEYLLRKLQILVGEGTVSKDDVLIYYFNTKEDENEKVTRKIQILENGSLSDDFGEGFWDEATRLQMELLKIKRKKDE